MYLAFRRFVLPLFFLVILCSAQVEEEEEEEEAGGPAVNSVVNLISNTHTCASRMRHFDGPCSSSLSSSFTPNMALYSADSCRQLDNYNECIRSKLQSDQWCRQAKQLMFKTIDDDYRTKCGRFEGKVEAESIVWCIVECFVQAFFTNKKVLSGFTLNLSTASAVIMFADKKQQYHRYCDLFFCLRLAHCSFDFRHLLKTTRFQFGSMAQQPLKHNCKKADFLNLLEKNIESLRFLSAKTKGKSKVVAEKMNNLVLKRNQNTCSCIKEHNEILKKKILSKFAVKVAQAKLRFPAGNLYFLRALRRSSYSTSF